MKHAAFKTQAMSVESMTYWQKLFGNNS